MKTTFCFAIAIAVIVISTPLGQALELNVEFTRAWDQQFGFGRFTILSQFNNQAVFDKETGLVWERSPSTGTLNWYDALAHCNTLAKGGRLGWRLPTLQELASLVDISVPAPGPALPIGHPFSNVALDLYWSATTDATDTSHAWIVFFSVGVGVVFDQKKSYAGYVWCVRGGQGVDPQ